MPFKWQILGCTKCFSSHFLRWKTGLKLRLRLLKQLGTVILHKTPYMYLNNMGHLPSSGKKTHIGKNNELRIDILSSFGTAFEEKMPFIMKLEEP